MPVDVARLQAMGEITDPVGGISERFVEVPLRSGSTVGVLSIPAGSPGHRGWVVSHSYGPEQPNLGSFDAALARRLASQGAPVLRFHCQGYGDSEHTDFTPSVESHVRDTIDAVEAFRTLSGVRSVGLVGVNFGATCALLAASEASVDQLALISPAVQGSRFLHKFVRTRSIIEVSESTWSPDAPNPWSVLKAGGTVNIRGFVLGEDEFRSFEAVDLRTVDTFSGSALVVQISVGSEPRREITELVDHLESSGVSVTRATITDQFAALLGDRPYRRDGGQFLEDVHPELRGKVAELVADWGTGSPAPRAVMEERT